MTVTAELLATLKALAHAPYDRTAMEASILAYLEDGLPDWTAATGDNLRRSLPLISELVFLYGETVNASWDMGQLVRAQGDYLDIFGVNVNLPRLAGESDDPYRLRLANVGTSGNIGSLASIENRASKFQDTIADVQAVVGNNRQDVAVHALKADHVALTTVETAALLTHLNERDGVIAGVVVTVPAVTETGFTIEVEIRHSTAVSADLIEADARAALYRWLDGAQRIGEPVYMSAVSAAAFIEGAENVTVSEPSADLAAVAGTVYTCPSTEVAVVITTVTS